MGATVADSLEFEQTAWAVVADAGRDVVVDVDGVDARGPQRVALQVQRLGAVCFRDAGVANQHVS